MTYPASLWVCSRLKVGSGGCCPGYRYTEVEQDPGPCEHKVLSFQRRESSCESPMVYVGDFELTTEEGQRDGEARA